DEEHAVESGFKETAVADFRNEHRFLCPFSLTDVYDHHTAFTGFGEALSFDVHRARRLMIPRQDEVSRLPGGARKYLFEKGTESKAVGRGDEMVHGAARQQGA